MGFTEIAQDKYRTEPSTHRLLIDGMDFSDKLISATVTYSTDVGGSGLVFDTMGSLEDYEDAPIDLWLGYGDMMLPYFVGNIISPKDNEVLNTSSGTAYGPFKNMNQVIGSRETFVGQTLQWLIMEMAYRSQMRGGDIEIRGGKNYNIDGLDVFPFDTTCIDVLNTVFEKFNFIGMDIPGGKRLFMRKPKPGVTSAAKGEYGPDNYRSFTIDPTNETSYFKVVVYREDELGNNAVYAEQDISNLRKFKPPRNRWFVISDFQGTQEEAEQECYDTAISLRAGEKKFTLNIAFNPDIHLWSGVRVSRIKFTDSGKLERRLYVCTVDDTITVNYTPGDSSMEITGSAYEISNMREIIEPYDDVNSLSSGLLRPSEIAVPAPLTMDDWWDIDDPTIQF